MQSLRVSNLGPIKQAAIEFGDLTFFVGPQASGKSILLQMLKLVVDKKHIRKTLEQYGFIWSNQLSNVLDRYFGEGMSGIWNVNEHNSTEVTYNGKIFRYTDILPKRRESIKDAEERLFYVPAQRVVCFQNGWPRFFNAFEDSVPYVLRHYSETIRQLLENLSGSKGGMLFPQQQRLKAPLRDSFNQNIFHDGKIILDKKDKKQFKLSVGESEIPFMAWSAGQKEFMPLLLSFYWLCPASKASTKESIKYVVVEEPEMGLHPKAIKSVMLQILDLMSRGYKVIVSTHSPLFLEFTWAFKSMQDAGLKDNVMYELFGLNKSAPLTRLFKDVLSKQIMTYFFNRNKDGVTVEDISSLDASSDNEAVSEWGGLTSFSAKASDIVLNAVLNGERKKK